MDRFKDSLNTNKRAGKFTRVLSLEKKGLRGLSWIDTSEYTELTIGPPELVQYFRL
jgi:hypothetical protein